MYPFVENKKAGYSTRLSTVVTDTLTSEFDKAFGVLAQANCSGLKPGVFNMGACKDGWNCISNGLACFCVPHPTKKIAPASKTQCFTIVWNKESFVGDVRFPGQITQPFAGDCTVVEGFQMDRHNSRIGFI